MAAFIHAFVAFAEGGNDQVNSDVKTRITECDNFYKHVCHGGNEELHRTSPEFLKTLLYQKLKGILEDEYSHTQKPGIESGVDGDHVNIELMAKKLYSICVKDQQNSKEKVQEALKQVLRSAGIDEWPLMTESHQQYDEVLKKTGLRPVATIAAVPDPKNLQFMLAVNAPLPRFAAYPDAMVQIRSRHEMHKAYKDLIRMVLNLFCGRQSNKVGPKAGSDQDSSNHEEQRSMVEEPQNAPEKDRAIEQVISDIIDVEVKIAEMIIKGRGNDYYQTDTAQNWQKRFGKFPIFTGLEMDVTRAKRTLANNYEIGVHLIGYFKELAKYLETLPVRKLINYAGWYFAREVADVMTSEVRQYLNRFLGTVSKPGIQVVLNKDHCIDKLIGYHGVMEAGVAHLYLLRYFGQRAINEASEMARHLNSSFYSFVSRNSWMDQETHEKSLQWMSQLQYQMGAPHKLLDDATIQQQYDLVKLPTQDNLLRYIYAYRDNNFLQMLRKNREAYDRNDIWPVSTLATHGRYSEFYTCLGVPAGALQEPVFRYNASSADMFGSMGTLTAEKLADALLIEGRMWLDRRGKYAWTEHTKKSFKERLACLKKKNSRPKNSGKKLEVHSQERFERRGDDGTLSLKLFDHIGLRTSYNAFIEMTSETGKCRAEFQRVNIQNLQQEFFTSFAKS
nr:neprilysin-11-like isoform X2 [Dermacentor andersoni]